MLRRLATLTVFLALLAGVLACTSTPETDDDALSITVDDTLPITDDDAPPITDDAIQTVDDVPRITVEELKAELDKGSVTVIDTRGTRSYEISHMPGALDIPEEDIRSRAGELTKGQLIVTYCT